MYTLLAQQGFCYDVYLLCDVMMVFIIILVYNSELELCVDRDLFSI